MENNIPADLREALDTAVHVLDCEGFEKEAHLIEAFLANLAPLIASAE